jgi:hypothetical protein
MTSFANIFSAKDSNAEHIFQWARNSSEHFEAMRAARSYPEGENFSTSRAMGLLAVATKTFRDMKQDRAQCGEYTSEDILHAAALMASWDGEE